MKTALNITSQTSEKVTRVLIVESGEELGDLWQSHLKRLAMQVHHVSTQNEAIDFLQNHTVDIIVLNLVLAEGAAFAVSDYAQYCQPEARVIFVTNTSFFSDGSIFAHAGNARAFMPSDTPPADLAAMIEHYGSEQR